MNDRLKFRVWDNENNEYLDEAYPSSMYSDGNLYAFEEKYDAISNEKVALLEIPNNRLIVEQCTGLRDKNGKLIYEGDVLQYTDTNGFKIQQEVVWDSENARFAHVVDWGCFDRTFSPLEQEICALKEVVGNIHEVEK